MPNKPIVTVKVTKAQISRGVGPNVHVKILVKDGPKITRFGSGETWVYQAPASGGAYSAKIEFTEMDPVYPDTGSTNKTLSVSTASPPPQKGKDTAELTVQAVGGDVGKSAKSTFEFSWWVTPSARDVAEFMVGEMKANAASKTASDMRENHQAALRMRVNPLFMVFPVFPEASAILQFVRLVDTGGAWDYKNLPAPRGIYATYGEFTLDARVGKLYRSDVWGNIHFGFVGRAITFSEDFLLDGAGFQQGIKDGKSLKDFKAAAPNFRNLDQAEDSTCISLGAGLWDRLGSGITADDLLQAIRRAEIGEAKKDAPEGVPPDSFLRKIDLIV
jgi:hypothetical protein